MNEKELRAALKKAKNVWVWVAYSDNDAAYMRVSKSSVLSFLENRHAESYRVDQSDLNAGNLYIG